MKAVQAMDPQTALDSDVFLRSHFSLPALPEVLVKVQEAIFSDYVSIRSVANYLRVDSALVAQVLKIVNSAYYGMPRTISEVEVAIAYLGLREVHYLTLSASVIDQLVPEDRAAFNGLRHHSILTALWAKYLARKYEPHLRLGELWAAAILHDIGKFVYLKFFADEYRRLCRYVDEQGCLFSEAEGRLRLPASARLGTLLCDHWHLPARVRTACAAHTLHDLHAGDEPVDAFTRMIILGNLLAILSDEALAPQKEAELAEAVQAELHLTDNDYFLLMGPTPEFKIWARRLMD